MQGRTEWVKTVITIGIDAVEINRVKKAIERHPSFQKRFYTEREEAYALSRKTHAFESFASSFAAKEAFYKAMRTGFREGAWKEVEVLRDEYGAPYIVLHGRTKEMAEERGIVEICLSVTHTREFALAEVLLRREE